MIKYFSKYKFFFYLCNFILIVLYLFPGSILGLLLYNDVKKQPQLTSDFIIFSSNHVYIFMVLSLLGLLSYYKNKVKILFSYLFFISIFLEFCHAYIPQRSFEYEDLIGNILGIFLTFTLFYLYKFLKEKK